ncbi:hypothetical protein FRB90_006367 [Tulasnella sp. 427]|nr:hypothetical protein FRB90_006367 [Tulasnella sp. 427]
MFYLTRRARRWLLYSTSLFIIFIVFTDVEIQSPQTTPKPRPPPRKRERRIKEVWNRPDPEDVVPHPLLDRTRLWLGSNTSAVPATKIHRHVPGWTLMDNVYVLRGILYIVSDDPRQSRIPHIPDMISSGKPIRKEPGDEQRRIPTDQNMQIIDSRRALQLFGSSVKHIEGTSFMIYEPSQYFSSGFRFAAEILFGLWRTYSSLDLEIESNGKTTLPAPQRIILPNILASRWRDGHGLIARLLAMLFPSAHVQPAEAWSDFADLVHLPHLFDRVLLADRGAAARGTGWHDTPFAMLTAQFTGNSWWWDSIKNVLSETVGKEYQSSEDAAMKGRPVITYIVGSTAGGRVLHPDDHDDLVRQLNQLEGLYGYAIRVHRWSSLTLQDQLEIGRQTDVLMALHGEALLPLLWMSRGPKSSIIEFHAPEVEDERYEDYAWTASALNISAYSFYGSSVAYKYPQPAKVSRARGSSSTDIRIDGKAVATVYNHPPPPLPLPSSTHKLLTMTVYYTLTFGLLLAEMGTFVALLLPMPFAARKRIFTFLSTSTVVAKLAYGLKIAFVFIGVLFVDALQRVLRVTAESDLAKQSGVHAGTAETSHAAKKFYAQRNLYLTAFTLFLSPLLTRTYYIILDFIHVQDEYIKLKEQHDQLAKTPSSDAVADLQKQLASKTRDLEELQRQLPTTDKKAA